MGYFSLIERVILSAGAMLIFSVYFLFTVCPEGRKDILTVQYNPTFLHNGTAFLIGEQLGRPAESDRLTYLICSAWALFHSSHTYTEYSVHLYILVVFLLVLLDVLRSDILLRCLSPPYWCYR